jgi:hypothetical protein
MNHSFFEQLKLIKCIPQVLESFHIMDYSFLIGVHQIDTMFESSGVRNSFIYFEEYQMFSIVI